MRVRGGPTIPALVPVKRRGRPPRELVVLATVAVLGLALVLAGTVHYALRLAGLSPVWALAVFAGSLLGSGVDIPLARLRAASPDVLYVPVRLWGMVVWLVPVERPPVTLAINLGGAVIPVAVSVYVTAHTGRWLAAAATVLAVALVVHQVAVPVQDIGVVMPVVLPAAVSAGVACLLAPGADALAVAYVGGTLGSVIGADVGNLRWLRRMRGAVLSIGGAGTFDGVFVSGVLAVVLAGFASAYVDLLSSR